MRLKPFENIKLDIKRNKKILKLNKKKTKEKLYKQFRF